MTNRIRIYSPLMPYPVDQGAFRVIFDQTLSLLEMGHSVELVSWKDSPAQFEEKAAAWRKRWPAPELRRLDSRPRGRLTRVVGSLFSAMASAEAFYYPDDALILCNGLGECDLAIYHYSFAHAWLSRPSLLAPERRRAVHLHNLESDLFSLRARASTGLARYIHAQNSRKLAAHERHLASLCDELWFLSPLDLAQYGDTGRAKKRLIPPTYTCERSRWVQDASTSMDPRSVPVLGFIGGFDFQPNIDSLLWITQQLAPELDRAGFKGKIRVAGRGAERVLGGATRPANLEVLPERFDVDEFFSELSWMLVPHVSGSGVRIKMLDAFVRKIPILATTAAVARIHPELQTHPLIFASDQPSEWVARVMAGGAVDARRACLDLPFPKALLGTDVYRGI